MLCLSGFELYSRWVHLILSIWKNRSLTVFNSHVFKIPVSGIRLNSCLSSYFHWLSDTIITANVYHCVQNGHHKYKYVTGMFQVFVDRDWSPWFRGPTSIQHVGSKAWYLNKPGSIDQLQRENNLYRRYRTVTIHSFDKNRLLLN